MVNSETEITGSERRVWVAVLGKHPGWNDHLDDIALDTEVLVSVKRNLYVEGIGGLINAGTWEALAESEIDEGFAHTFFWRQPDGIVIGRMWSSSDGKGRRKYPMIACAMCRSLPFSFVAGPLLDRLRRLEATCKNVNSAAEVIAATDAMGREITELASHVHGLDSADLGGMGSAAQLIDSGVLGDEGVGLKRVLYQIDREMSAFIRPDTAATASRSRSIEIRGQHIRLPLPTTEDERAQEQTGLGLWCRLMLTKIDPLVPMMFVTRDDRPWVDVIVGELGVTPLACLQTNLAGLPFGSDIPFTIEGETEAQLDASIAASRAGDVSEKDPCFLDVPQDRLAPFLRPKRTERADDGSGKGKLYLIIGAAVVLIIVLVVIGLGAMVGGGAPADATSENTKPNPPETQQATEDRPRDEGITKAIPSKPDTREIAAQEPNSAGSDHGDRLQAFAAWCETYEHWYLPFVKAIDTVDLSADAGLNSRLTSAIKSAKSAGDIVDPLRMTPGRYRSLESLRATPPDEIYEPAFGQTIESGQRLIDAVLSALDEGVWEPRARLKQLAARASESGAKVPRSIHDTLEKLEGSNGASAAESVSTVLAVAPLLSRAAGQINRLDGFRERLDSSPADTAASAFGILNVFEDADGATASAWIESVATNATALAGQGEQLEAAAETLLPRIDTGLLADRLGSSGSPKDSDSAKEYLSAWLSAMNDKSLYLLDPKDDPRRGLPDDSAIAALQDQLDKLSSQAENAETRELGGILGVVAETTSVLRSLSWNEATRDRIQGESADVIQFVSSLNDRLDAERRGREFEAETYLAELRATESITTSDSAAIDKAWGDWKNGAIASYEAAPDLVALSRSADSARATLAALETAMPALEIDDGTFAEAAGVLREAAAQHRENIIADAAMGAIMNAETSAAQEMFDKWASNVANSSEVLAHLRADMERWAVASDASKSIARNWFESWAASQIDLAEYDQGLDSYIRACLAGSTDEAVAIAGDASSSPGAVFAAWDALEGFDQEWGGSPEQLEIDSNVVRRLRGVLSADSTDAEKAESIRTISTRRWLKAAHNSGETGFAKITPLAEELWVDESSLPADARLNLFIANLRRSVTTGDSFNREGLLEHVRTLQDGAPQAAIAWLTAFEGELASREGREVDYSVIGPGRAGWSREVVDSGRRLVYTWQGGKNDRRLAFRYVESPTAGKFYLSETEAPLWLLTEFGLSGERAQSVSEVMPPDWEFQTDTRLGPRVWGWTNYRGKRALQGLKEWVQRDASGSRQFYAAELQDTINKPEINHPLQRVSPKAAAVLAAAAGCRLPTEAEWRAAYASIGSTPASSESNLRDATFEIQRAYTASRAGISVIWADQQSFSDGISGVKSGRDAVSHPWSDSVLWFSPVDSKGSAAFPHLVGNVAEYVLPGTSDAGLMSDRGGDVRAHISGISGRSAGLGLGIIGGSALSAPSIRIDQSVRPEGVDQIQGFSDVGFRLAFSPGVEAPLVIVVGEALNDAPYLRSKK